MSQRRTRAFAALCLAACSSACAAPADRDVPVDSLVVIPAAAEYCDDCITLGDSIRIGSERDSVILSTVPHVAVDSRGRTYLADRSSAGKLILVYDREGRFAGTLGARGEGPGEYETVRALAIGPADSLFISVDYMQLLVYSPDGKLRRDVPAEMDWPMFLAVLPDSRVLTVDSKHAPERRGLPIHLMDSEGRIVRSFGHESINPPGAIAERLITVGSGGRIWIGERHNYRFDETDTSGRILRTLGVSLPEDRVYINRDAIDSAIAATPRVNLGYAMLARPEHLQLRPILTVGGAYIDSAGRLWTSVRTAVKNWQEVPITYKKTDPDHVAEADDIPLITYDTTIDVIDLKSGTLLARRRLPGYGELANDGRLIRVRSSSAGYIEVTVTSLNFSR